MGFRGMSPKQIARMMKKMGIEQKEMKDVKEVVIRFKDKEWLIENPQVMLIKQSGNESFQVSGKKIEREVSSEKLIESIKDESKEIEIPMEDAALVAGQTGVSIEMAIEALRETEGDLAAAILKLRHS